MCHDWAFKHCKFQSEFQFSPESAMLFMQFVCRSSARGPSGLVFRYSSLGFEPRLDFKIFPCQPYS